MKLDAQTPRGINGFLVVGSLVFYALIGLNATVGVGHVDTKIVVDFTVTRPRRTVSSDDPFTVPQIGQFGVGLAVFVDTRDDAINVGVFIGFGLSAPPGCYLGRGDGLNERVLR